MRQLGVAVRPHFRFRREMGLTEYPHQNQIVREVKNLTQLSGRGPFGDFITMTTAGFLPVVVQSPDAGFLMEQGGV